MLWWKGAEWPFIRISLWKLCYILPIKSCGPGNNSFLRFLQKIYPDGSTTMKPSWRRKWKIDQRRGLNILSKINRDLTFPHVLRPTLLIDHRQQERHRICCLKIQWVHSLVRLWSLVSWRTCALTWTMRLFVCLLYYYCKFCLGVNFFQNTI